MVFLVLKELKNTEAMKLGEIFFFVTLVVLGNEERPFFTEIRKNGNYSS